MSSEEARLERLSSIKNGEAIDRVSEVKCFTPRAVRLRGDTILTPETPPVFLKADFANIHAFSALTDVAVLDVLMPPYNAKVGRCHYRTIVSWFRSALLF